MSIVGVEEWGQVLQSYSSVLDPIVIFQEL